MDGWWSEGRGLEGWVKKVKGLRTTDWKLQRSHRDVAHNRKYVLFYFNNCMVSGVLEVVGNHCVQYLIVWHLYSIPETNTK